MSSETWTGAAGPVVLLLARRRDHGHEPDDVRHAPAPDHLAGDVRHLLEVGLGARRDVAVDQLLGGAAAERADDPRPRDSARRSRSGRSTATGTSRRARARAGRSRPCAPGRRRARACRARRGRTRGRRCARAPPADSVILRSAPSTIRSSASARSAALTRVVVAPRGDQRRLVDEVAQVGADHARASTPRARSRSTSSASGTERVWIFRISHAPVLVGRVDGRGGGRSAPAAAARGRAPRGGSSRRAR